LVSLLAFFAVSIVMAQTPDLKFRHLTGEDGRSQTHVISVTQHHKGFIRIVTPYGLIGTTGYKFWVYEHDPTDSINVNSHDIRYTLEDHDKNYGTKGLAPKFIMMDQLI
jgi:hypothetical protein